MKGKEHRLEEIAIDRVRQAFLSMPINEVSDVGRLAQGGYLSPMVKITEAIKDMAYLVILEEKNE